ncbi:Neural proliferation differentiation and control protein 1 [Bagarius yarrelli]|uniref:Neural proliferation differentiation and control protein 1 n=1 Tax=Bagarius yarrelli TaxID=175774 RepID=A0A556TUB6_BAGYA|nr:Neural proliferation differentiation and control protein 1 [Bagarius yarrelli]
MTALGSFLPSLTAEVHFRMRLSLSSRMERLSGVLLLGVLLAAVSASIPVKHCPNRIDCARAGRQFCKPGSSQCGPCLSSLQENEEGHYKDASLADLDEQIDYLSSFIDKEEASDIRQSVMMSAFIILGTAALIMAAFCWFRMQKDSHLTEKVDYPPFYGGGSGSSSCTSLGDKKLAQSAQMYHFQHQKQQMLSMEKHKVEPKVSEPGAVSEEETEEGDFTVYECPGLAPTGEMEVKNPLFDDSTLQNGRNHK